MTDHRLQPSAIVTDEDCAACVFNKPGKNCLRQMNWVWRGETFAATSSEYYSVKNQLASEPLPPEHEGGPPRSFDSLPWDERQKLLKDRLKKYCQKVFQCISTQASDTYDSAATKRIVNLTVLIRK